MATNLVSVAMQFLTPDMIAKIASSLGLDRNIAQKAIGGAVPALLAMLTDVASTPNGARQLSNVVTQQQFGSLERVKGLMIALLNVTASRCVPNFSRLRVRITRHIETNRSRTCASSCPSGQH